VEARTVTLETSDGPMPVYEVIPDEPKGAVVVIQEVFGVNEHIQDVTRRFADAGYHAVAPHLFHRSGSPELGYEDFGAVMPHMQHLDDDRILADVDCAITHLNEAGWGTPQIGLVGFCFGGRIAFLVASARPLGAAVGFYGGGIVTARFPQFPALIDRAPDIKAPFLGLFGDQDQSIPVEDVERIRSELDAHVRLDHDVVRYPDAGHGFHCDRREGHYHEASAKDAWQKTLAWLDQHLQ
jgi:carboxymethylenebutenolidase